MTRFAGAIGMALAAALAGCDTGISPASSPTLAAPLAPAPPAPPTPTAPAPDLVSGSYTLTAEVSTACTIPDAVRHRTYSATIEPKPRAEWGATNSKVTLKGATFREGCGDNPFAPGMGCNQFEAYNHGDRIQFFMSDLEWGWGGQIVEQLPGGHLIISGGTTAGRLEGLTINAAGRSDVLYCPAGSSCQECWQTDIRLEFIRQ